MEREEGLYQAWAELIAWMQEYAKEKGVRFIVEAYFPDTIYRFTKPWNLPTRWMSVSLADARGERFVLASVSQPDARSHGVEVRFLKAHIYWHLHFHEGALVLEGQPLTKARLFKTLDEAKAALAA